MLDKPGYHTTVAVSIPMCRGTTCSRYNNVRSGENDGVDMDANVAKLGRP